MVRALNSLALLFAVAGLIFFSASCGTDHAKVRFVHASPDAGALDVTIDGKNVVTGITFGNVSPATDYLTIAAGNRRVEVQDTGTTSDQINSTVDFANQRSYTLLATGKVSDQTIAALLKTDDNSAPPSGNIKLRLIHDAPDGPTHIDVYVVGPGTDITSLTPNISSLSYQQASDYLSLTAATYELIVTDTADPAKNPIIDQNYDVAAGQIRTFVTLNVQGGTTMATAPLVLNDLN
jgi:Domain of unknown function (DUF4397)